MCSHMIYTTATVQAMYRIKLAFMFNHIFPRHWHAPLVRVVFYSCLDGKTGFYRSYHWNMHSWANKAFLFWLLFLFIYLHLMLFSKRRNVPPLKENRRTYLGIFNCWKQRKPVLLAARGLSLVERLQCLSQPRFTSWKPHSRGGPHDLTRLHERQGK